jgi:hypothetical protein
MTDIVDQPDWTSGCGSEEFHAGIGRGHRRRHPNRGDSRVPWQPDRDQLVGIDENVQVGLPP